MSHFLRTRPADPGTVSRDEHWRLRIEADAPGGNVEVADERMTSSRPTAQVMTGEKHSLFLTQDEARWLHRQLGEFLALPPDPPSNDIDEHDDASIAEGLLDGSRRIIVAYLRHRNQYEVAKDVEDMEDRAALRNGDLNDLLGRNG